MAGHTIVTTYRDRPEQLKKFLMTLNVTEDTQLVIVNLGSQKPFKFLLERNYTNAQVDLIEVPYTGLFWKSKAINLGIYHANYDYITIMDCDVVFTNNFWLEAEKHFKDHAKVAYKCNYTSAYAAPMETNGHLTGCGLFTTQRKYLKELNGFNEEFMGWGNENPEFNTRFWNAYGDAWVFPTAVQHIDHDYDNGWRTRENEDKNSAIYERLKAEGFPKPLNPEMGIFDKYLNPVLRDIMDAEFKKQEDKEEAELMKLIEKAAQQTW